MDNLTNISVVKELLSKHGFTFSKSLGQNFIINPDICPKMAEESIESDKIGVLEIGPGIGVLTNELCKRAKKVVSVELDKTLFPILEETLCEYDNLKIINSDILKTDIKKLIETEFVDMDVVVCANLPYYITSPVIMKFLEDDIDIKSMTVMVQKEAAQRICANVGSRESGALTVAVNFYSDPSLLFNVSKGSFMPSPKVDSSVIKLVINKEKNEDISDKKLFFRIVRGSFSQRRKTLLNSLSSSLSIDKNIIGDILKSQSIDENLRAEKVSIEQFKDIYREMKKRGL